MVTKMFLSIGKRWRRGGSRDGIREREVVHLVANYLTKFSVDLPGVGDREDGFPVPHGRGDEFHHGSPGIDPRSLRPKLPKPRHIHVPDLHIDGIKVKTRDFR
jgi:error-prone DNA polymerase